MSLPFRLAAAALALVASTTARPAAANSDCVPGPIEADFFYPAVDGATDGSGIPTDAILVVGFSKDQCDEPPVSEDAVAFTLIDLSASDGSSLGSPVPATLAPLPDDDVLSRFTHHGFTISPEAPLTPGVRYLLAAEGEDLASDPASVSFVVIDEATRHAAPPELEVTVVAAGDGYTDLDVSFERPPQAHGVVLFQLTTAEGRPIGRPVLPRAAEATTRQSFGGLPDGADGGCLQPLLRAPDGAVLEGEPSCFTLDGGGGGGCSAGGQHPGTSAALVAALAALALVLRRTTA